jgi:integrase/recombinase XerD
VTDFRVREVASASGARSWTVTGSDALPIPAIDRFLGYLTSINRSPNTVRAYAYDLKSYASYLHERDVAWNTATIEHVGGYIAHLRRIVSGDAGSAPRSRTTVSRHLAAIGQFYGYQHRLGADVAHLLKFTHVNGKPTPGYKHFLAHVSRDLPQPQLAVPWRADERRREDPTLTRDQVQRALEACSWLRDRLLLATLYETGARIGEVLGLHIDDVEPRALSVAIVRRDNPNGARVKSLERALAVSPEYIELYNEYLDTEYGAIDSDYLFVNLFRTPIGEPMRESNTNEIIARISKRTGIKFTAHAFRHTFATDLLRAGVAREVVQYLLGHRRIESTMVYEHLNLDDLREALRAARADRAVLAR